MVGTLNTKVQNVSHSMQVLYKKHDSIFSERRDRGLRKRIEDKNERSK